MSDGFSQMMRDIAEEREKRQCPALAITMHMNHCVLKDGHDGKHRNSLGQIFTKTVDCNDVMLLHGEITAMCACDKHPRYGAKRRPKTSCEGCWRLWILTHPDWDLETRWAR